MPRAFIRSSSIITQMHPDVKKSQGEGAGSLTQGWFGCWSVELGWVVVNSDRDLRSSSSPAVRVSKGGVLIDKWVSVLAVSLVIEMISRVERSNKLHRMSTMQFSIVVFGISQYLFPASCCEKNNVKCHLLVVAIQTTDSLVSVTKIYLYFGGSCL